MKRKLPAFELQMTQADKQFTTITVFKQGAGRMLFQGDAIWQWGLGFENADGSRDHIRNHGKNICWAEWLHNGLEGMHTCILYTGDKFCIHEGHPDYDFVSQLWDYGLMNEREVLKLLEEAT